MADAVAAGAALGYNRFDAAGQMMVNKVTTAPRTSLIHRVGRLSDSDVVALDRALVVFLGLAV